MKFLGMIKKKKVIQTKTLYEYMHFPTAVGSLIGDDENVLITGSEKINDGRYQAKIDFLLHKEDADIIDAKFQAKGPLILIGFLEALCQMMIRKKFYYIEGLSADELEKQFQEDLPWSTLEMNALNLALSAFDEAVDQVYEKKVLEKNRKTPVMKEDFPALLYPHWNQLKKAEKLDLIEKMLEKEIQPYIAMDGGGIEILEFDDHQRLTIRYQGSCTSCYSAIGGTLTAIQDILRTKLSPEIEVVPDPASVDFDY